MRFNLKNTLLFLTILALAASLRFYKLGEVPVGLHRDEAFLGYNAYSILKTGRDINNQRLPLHLASFLYSPAGYAYASIPSIAIFDLNALSVRLPSALLGTLTIPLVYLLIMRLFKNYHSRSALAFVSSLLMAISPWHINLSRTATENVLVVFLVTAATYLYISFFKKKLNSLVATGALVLFGSTLLIYQASRVFLPLFLPILIFLFRQQLKLKQQLLLISLFFFLIVLPIILIISSPNLSLRLKAVSIFSTAENQLVLDELIREDGTQQIKPFYVRLWHNKFQVYAEQFFKNYFSHLSYNFLFTDAGLPLRYKVPGAGLLHFAELPFLLGGIIFLIFKRKREHILLLSWVLFGLIGSALTFDDIPNLQRTLIIFPALPIITSLGLVEMIARLKRTKLIFYTGQIIVLLSLGYNLSCYLHQYYIHQRLHRPWYRHEGYRELVFRVNELLPKYRKVVISDRESAPTIFFLFFTKYDPIRFQVETTANIMTDFDRINFSKFEFTQTECPLEIYQKFNKQTGRLVSKHSGEPNVLYVNAGACKQELDYFRELATIRRVDGSLVFRIAELK